MRPKFMTYETVGTAIINMGYQSHLVQGGYPHERVGCTKDRYKEGEKNQCMGCQARWPLVK